MYMVWVRGQFAFSNRLPLSLPPSLPLSGVGRSMILVVQDFKGDSPKVGVDVLSQRCVCAGPSVAREDTLCSPQGSRGPQQRACVCAVTGGRGGLTAGAIGQRGCPHCSHGKHTMATYVDMCFVVCSLVQWRLLSLLHSSVT